MRLSGKRAIITGAASGMGLAGVERFTREGATVVAIDVDAQRLRDLGNAYQSRGLPVIPLQADLSHRVGTQEVMQRAIATLGGLDVLWLHAGIPVFGELGAVDLAAYDRATELNVTGPLVSVGVARPYLRASGRGSIIFTSSISGLVGSPTSPVYCAHKFAAVGLAKSLCLHLGVDGIRVNAICPGYIDTPMLANVLSKLTGSEDEIAEGMDKLRAAVPVGRIGTAEEVANVALWLASDESSYVTGAAIPIDGGLTAR